MRALALRSVFVSLVLVGTLPAQQTKTGVEVAAGVGISTGHDVYRYYGLVAARGAIHLPVSSDLSLELAVSGFGSAPAGDTYGEPPARRPLPNSYGYTVGLGWLSRGVGFIGLAGAGLFHVTSRAGYPGGSGAGAFLGVEKRLARVGAVVFSGDARAIIVPRIAGDRLWLVPIGLSLRTP